MLYERPDLGLRIDGRGHALVAHEASEASEWGLSGTVTFNQDGPGLNLALSPTWGETPERTALWGRSPDSALEPEVEEAPGAGLRASLGYGIATRGGRGRLVPFAETELREGERPAVRFGTRWQGRDGANVEIAVARSGSDGAAVRVAATVRW